MIIFDTDICISILRNNRKIIQRREKETDRIGISFMTAGELYYGVWNSENIEHNRTLVDQFLMTVEVIESDKLIMNEFGKIKSYLKREGILLADADVLIGATTFQRGKKLITGNIKHFERIPDLKLEDWLTGAR